MKNKVLLIAGVSGAGKSYLHGALDKEGFKKLITMTSREPRIGEVDGIDYFFKGPPYFERMIAGDKMIECALVYGNYYGMSEGMFDEMVERANGAPVYVIVDPLGVKAYQDALKGRYNVKTLFLDCPVELRKLRIAARAQPDATDRELYQIAERLIVTEQFEERWKSMTTYDAYMPIMENEHDVEKAIRLVERAFRDTHAPCYRSEEPAGFMPPEALVRQEMSLLRKSINLKISR